MPESINFSLTSKQAWALTVLTGFSYFLLVTGGVLPVSLEGGAKSLLKGVGLLLAFALLLLGGVKARSVRYLFVFVSLGLLFTVPRLFGSDNIILALEKIDGAVIAPALIFMALHTACSRFGETATLKSFVGVAFVVLLVTVAYKASFGFLDRGVRFFLNGPIVFGWIMGTAALCSLGIWQVRRRVVPLLMVFLFVLGVLWTQSKGPAFALLLGLVSYFALTLRRNFRVLVLVLVFGASLLAIAGDALHSAFSESRFGALPSLLIVENLSDVEVVGARAILIDEALRAIASEPLWGIGLGNFVFGEFYYPHNQHLEIFAELGLLPGILHLLFISLALAKGSAMVRSIIVFLIVASSFSGDISYLRFLYAFCLLGVHGSSFFVGERRGCQ